MNKAMPVTEDKIREASSKSSTLSCSQHHDLGLVYSVITEPAGEKDNVRSTCDDEPRLPGRPRSDRQSKQMVGAVEGVAMSKSEL